MENDTVDQFYWQITERDGTVTRIPPDSVEVVQRRWGEGKPIHTNTRSIAANQITSFRISNQRYTGQPEQKLLEDASQVFNEPIYSQVEGLHGRKYEAVQARWVKTVVTMERWQRYYSSIPSYHLLGEVNGMAEVAFLVATHDIDVNKTPYCSNAEVQRLTKG